MNHIMNLAVPDKITRSQKLLLTALCAFAISFFTPVSFAAAETDKVPRDDVQKISVFQAVILGVVEGLTEYLPVSSTGHLILAGHFMGMTRFSDQTGPFGRVLDKDKMEAINSFDIVIQLGAILAVLGLYRKRVAQMCAGLIGKNRQGLKLFCFLLVAFLPAAVIGLPIHKKIEQELFGPVPVAYALGIGGVLMIVVEHFFWRKKQKIRRVKDVNDILFWQAAVIGFSQVLAMWPGTSRSMITILAALVVGLDMVTAAEFSFLLALPTLMGATFFSAYEDWAILKEASGVDGMLVGLIVSGIVAALAVKGFVKWLTHHDLAIFGIYRIIAAALIFWLMAAK
ncbi:MAG: undecaprenyl-diphosphate phosphatase [Phycisphaerae bacterium]|jgi:undecaprenyl-diphosphatase